MMKKQKTNIKSWNRFLLRNIAVMPDVMGREHVFPFEKSTVTIKIPSIGQVNQGKGYDEIASVGARRIIDNKPVEYHIHKVDVEVFIPATVSIPTEALSQPANAYELFSNKEQNNLNAVARQHQLIAEKAFEYWIRVSRWVCDDFGIGRNQAKDFQSGWSTYLIDTDENKKIWIKSQIFHVAKYKTLKLEEWGEIESKLLTNSQPPIYIELKHNAEENIRLGDYGRSLVNMAMACETFLRYAVLQKIPAELNNKLATYIEEGNISQYINKFFPEIIDESANKKFRKLKKELFKMFAQRNKLVHMGKDIGLNENLCRKFLETTQELLSLFIERP